MILYLSATGNSRHIARLLSKALGDSRLVDLSEYMGRHAGKTLSVEPEAGERIGFVFPVHSWGLPKGLESVISSIRAEGCRQNYCYMACTCGDDAGLTARQWSKAVTKAGFTPSAAFSVFMPNTYVIFPGFDVDSDSVRDEKLRNAPQAVQTIVDRILHNDTGDFTHHGSFATLKSKVVYPLFVRFQITDKPFAVSADTCISCGLCVKVCPTRNITLETSNGKALPRWHGDCLNCLACYHYCPTHSIAYGKISKGKGHYICNVKKEIKP